MSKRDPELFYSDSEQNASRPDTGAGTKYYTPNPTTINVEAYEREFAEIEEADAAARVPLAADDPTTQGVRLIDEDDGQSDDERAERRRRRRESNDVDDYSYKYPSGTDGDNDRDVKLEPKRRCCNCIIM